VTKINTGNLEWEMRLFFGREGTIFMRGYLGHLR
jgi:hypothetical protein